MSPASYETNTRASGTHKQRVGVLRVFEASMSPEEALWRSVVLQAFLDATSKAKDNPSQVNAHSARRWLLDGGADFRRVCWLASVEPETVRAAAKRIEAAGWGKAYIASLDKECGGNTTRKLSENTTDIFG